MSRMVSKPPWTGSRHAADARRVALADGRDELVDSRLLAVLAIDPVPREVRADDRGNAGVGGRGTGQRRRIGDDEIRAPCARSSAASRATSSANRSLKRARADDRFALVGAKAVDLDHAGVRLAGQPLDRPADRAVEQPRGRRRAHDRRAAAGATLAQRIDDGDLAHGVAEAVAGDVEEDGGHGVGCQLPVASCQLPVTDAESRQLTGNWQLATGN